MTEPRSARIAAGERLFGLGFLLSQLGAHSAVQFHRALEPLGIGPAHVGLMGAIGREPGRRQQALAEQFGMPPSRMVALVDELEERGLVERRPDANDRRAHQLHLTPAGRRTMEKVYRLAEQAEAALTASLTAAEHSQLKSLLRRIADEQGLTPGVHPGYRWLRPGS
ncbi:MAG TPA: MarR family transcriptional regulator [Mycobacteriales bacterium]|nr:MarR family transcriptional regulator [Mycobacteriales bacterium]